MAKQSFTYSGNPKTRRDAIRKAKKEKKTFSQLVESLLVEYISEPAVAGIDSPFGTAEAYKNMGNEDPVFGMPLRP